MASWWIAAALSLAAAPMVSFRAHTIAGDVKGAYQVLVFDVNRDGRPDLVALGNATRDLLWFENPGWQRHVITGGLNFPINVDGFHEPGSGAPVLVLGHQFSMEPSKSVGVVSVLRPQGDPRQPWSIQEIDRLPTTHRIRFANIDGSGRRVAVNAPLAGADTKSPGYKGKVPLVLYRPGEWKRELIAELEGVLHGLTVADWDGDGRDEIFTASFLGLDMFRWESGAGWKRTHIAGGNPEAWPKCGSSEVAVGRLGKRRFLCALEPWHGHQVVVYREADTGWERLVIDDSFATGHALAAEDLNGDGLDEIIAGYRDKDGRTYIYYSEDAEGRRWRRELLDAEMPAAACVAADLNGDGRLDLACAGGASIKWYENLGPQE